MTAVTQAHLESAAPEMTARQAEQLAADWFGVLGSARPAPSERDLNFLLDAPDQPAVLKISNPLVEEPLIDLQVAALEHLAGDPVPVPRVIRTLDGEPWRPLELPDGRCESQPNEGGERTRLCVCVFLRARVCGRVAMEG